jgi:DNA-directed RNA polymerase subunit beta
MAYSLTQRKRIRKNFGRYSSVAQMPNLIEIQKNSYDQFLQVGETADTRKNKGLEAVFKSVFPVEDISGIATLEYVKYEFGKPKYTVTECVARGLTYSTPLKVTVRLIVWEVDEDAGTREVMGIKEQEVYMADLPLMTDNGTFIVNGTEKVIVSQMHRSPGVFFDHDHGKTHSSGKILFSSRVIPYRGSWLDFEYDPKDHLYFRIDRRKKMHVTTLLRALGLSNQEIVDTYYKPIEVSKNKRGWSVEFEPENYSGELSYDLVNAEDGKVVIEAGKKLTPRKSKKLKEDGLKEVLLSDETLLKRYTYKDIVDSKTGEVILAAGAPFTEEAVEKIEAAKLKNFAVVDIPLNSKPYILDSLALDKNTNQEEAQFDIYRVMRPGEPPTPEAAEVIFGNLFFSEERYDLSEVGRMKINKRLGIEVSEETTVLTKEDIIEIIRKMVEIKDGKGETDDIDI